MSRLAAALVVGLAVLPVCVAQAASDSRPVATSVVKPREFDVVSIHVSKSETQSSRWSFGDDHFTAENITLPWFLQAAYDLKPYQITGVPKALEDLHIDVQAKVLPGDSGKPVKLGEKETRGMLILLLEQRFGLKVHLDTKTGPIYELVVAKGGSKMGPAAKDDVDGEWGDRWSGHTLQLTAKKISVGTLADYLADRMERPVIDKTGLEGKYDFTLKFAAEDSAGAETKDAGSSVFTAVEEQLGLKLVSAKGPVKVLVVEHVEMPSEN